MSPEKKSGSSIETINAIESFFFLYRALQKTYSLQEWDIDFTVWKSCDRYSFSTLRPTIFMDLIICTAVIVGIKHPVLLELASLDKFVLCCSSAVSTGEDLEPFICLQLGFSLFFFFIFFPDLFN